MTSLVNNAFEIHYTPQQLAALWGYSEKYVRNLFLDEEGVLKQVSKGGKVRSGRITLRIPGSVAIRVYQERVSKGFFHEVERRSRRV